MNTQNSSKEYKTEIFLLEEIKRVKDIINSTELDKDVVEVMQKYRKKLKSKLFDLRYIEIKKVSIVIKLVYVNADVCDIRINFFKSSGNSDYNRNFNFNRKDDIKSYIHDYVVKETKLSIGNTTFESIFNSLDNLNNSDNKNATIELTTSLS